MHNKIISLSHFHYSLHNPFVSFCLCFFPFLFHLLFSLSLTLIISIFYCLNNIRYYFISLQHTLYHTFPFHLSFSLYPTLTIAIFYCLNYTSLLLDLIITHLVNTFYNNYVINICPRPLLEFI